MSTEPILINSNSNPMTLFKEWFESAKKSEINDPNAMNLATISSNGKPSSRIVLLKSFSDKGFVFYTNSKSKKGKAIENNNNVALNFHWKSLQKQIRIEGTVNLIENYVADQYYNSRPLGSRIGAWASMQSEELDDRSTLLNSVAKYEKKFKISDISRPSYWNGYQVTPNLIEFWQEMPFRLHDRVEFRKEENNWISRKLYP
ncbi:pyridoxamine 5'-phosphate oxidase [Pelagibacteraceae bacterium]|nr:pyridoxamine 5'-phosphate oxidase [Pelagibacteraceae bacterium]